MSIETTIDGLIEQFTSAARGMFEVTRSYQTSYEQGIYGCVVVKPTKRMRMSLAVDREILTVVSTFADQQQRTIKFVKYEIDGSQGRYESSIVIIIHSDPDGNAKLKNWGRELGISVLPVLDKRLTEPNPQELDKILCVELYEHDPFDVTGPVSDDQNFFGRREEAIELARKLQRGEIRSCLGVRKIGKTSIINRVLREIKSNHECVSVMIDCSRDAIWQMTAPQLLVSMSDSVAAGIKSSDGYATIGSTTEDLEIEQAHIQLQNQILECDQPLIFIFDEVDYITPGSPTEMRWRTEFNIFWRNLRSIFQECDRRKHAVSVLVSGVSSYWFTVESIEGIENAALAFIPEEYLSPMPEGATMAMLRRLGTVAGLKFDEGATRAIARSSGNMPYWARKCCSYIHRQIPVNERPCDITEKRVEPLISAFVSEEGVAIAEVALSHLFRVHPKLKTAAKQCFDENHSIVPEVLKRALRRYGILTLNNEISGSMLHYALKSLHEEPVEVEGTPNERASNGGNWEEWAEELAMIGKRRNSLERRLREMVVNFIRFDYVNNKTGITVRERVARAIPQDRRNKLAHLSAEEIMSRLTWKELTELVERRGEWPIFERVFGDKRKFREMCDLVNDRPDAHAKEADQADIALYRRALNYLEEKIEKY